MAGFMKKLGNALKAPLKPLNKLAGKMPGGQALAGLPGAGAIRKATGIGPSPKMMPQLPPMPMQQPDMGMGAAPPEDMGMMQPGVMPGGISGPEIPQMGQIQGQVGGGVAPQMGKLQQMMAMAGAKRASMQPRRKMQMM